jgi:hypothetical protein
MSALIERSVLLARASVPRICKGSFKGYHGLKPFGFCGTDGDTLGVRNLDLTGSKGGAGFMNFESGTDGGFRNFDLI